MNKQSRIAQAAAPIVPANNGAAATPSHGTQPSNLRAEPGEAEGFSPVPSVSPDLITADARTTSPRQFLEALGLTSPESREQYSQLQRELCIKAIRRGDTYGFPQSLVSECSHIIAVQSREAY